MAVFRKGAFALATVSAYLANSAVAQGLISSIVTCTQISSAISSASSVYYAPMPQYIKGVHHWASSSSELSACAVEPGTAEDVGKILRIVGERRTPFAVKGGGHSLNPGFSSTSGVHISMTRFNQVNYNAATQTAEIGAGLIWDEVYEALEPHGVNVIGGRVSGVGVAGFILGGGYSWKSNHYGLTVDTIVSFELVLPDGTVKRVTAADEDLFFALKGGFNNFGIVTKFELQAFPQTEVFGGFMIFGGDKYPQILEATERYTNGAGNNDTKAGMIINLSAVVGVPISTVQIFYDAPTAPPGIFDDFLAIPGAITRDIKTRSFVSLVQSTPQQIEGLRGAFETVSTTGYDLTFLQSIADQTLSLCQRVNTTLKSGTFLNIAIEPFHPGVFTHGEEGSSAYPPTRSRALFPLNLYFAWLLPVADETFRDTIKESANIIQQAAAAQDLLPSGSTSEAWLYGNYAITGTPMERIYGNNVARLKSIRQTVDPQNVMMLAGGWKF